MSEMSYNRVFSFEYKFISPIKYIQSNICSNFDKGFQFLINISIVYLSSIKCIIILVME